MQKLISELTRLYLPDASVPSQTLQQRVLGQSSEAISLVTPDAMTRALVIAFDKQADDDGEEHWSLLCQVANALQVELGLPAPAVSISGAHGYRLWLSLEAPTPTATVQALLALLRRAYFPDCAPGTDAPGAPVELPPCLHPGTGKWAAFINPGLGASFAHESGLEMAPPMAGQAALLDHLKSISEAQLVQAMTRLEQLHGEAPVAAEPGPERAPAPQGLLLKDASVEQIVRHLHSMNIEPTLRHLIKGQ
jgi:hypothetical protein